jgi:hypothetical protein
MTLTDQFPPGCSPETFAAIEQAFEAVWTTLYAHVPLDRDESNELRIALSQTLVGLAADGITDPHQLRCNALESMVLSPR